MTNQSSNATGSIAVGATRQKSPKRAKLDRYLARKAQWLNDRGSLDRTYICILKGGNEFQMAEALGFSPLINPKNGVRYGSEEFYPFWTSLRASHDWFEMTVELGHSDFTFVIYFDDHDGLNPALRAMCRQYAEPVFN